MVAAVPGENQLDRFYRRTVPLGVQDLRTVRGLARQRVGVMDTLLDILTYDPLDRLRLHRTDVLCLYARHDPLLTMFWDLRDGGSYESSLKGICRKIRFVPVDGDHYLSSAKVKAAVLGIVHTFLSGGDPTDRATPSPGTGSA